MVKKYLAHVPTEQFGFISVEIEGTAEEAVEAYNEVKSALGGEGLSSKDFNTFMDEYLTTGTIVNGADRYAQMNKEQQEIIQCIKRSKARTKQD